MGYTKQNFSDGQVLTAEHLNHMEDGIYRPPLLPGVEYETAEQYNGDSVFIKRISFGSLPSSGSSSVSTGLSGCTCVSLNAVFHAGEDSEPYPIMGGSGPKCLCWTSRNCGQLYVQAISDVSSYTGEFIIKYTKW